MYGIIYMTTNLVNGKKYIGQHKCTNETDSYLGSGKIFLEAIKKYGRENFKRETLCICESEEELDSKEVEYIAKYEASHDNSFYNINEGGSANRMCGENNPMYGRKGPLAPGYGRKYTEEEIEMMRQRMLGEKNPMYGKPMSEEAKQKLSQSISGEKHWHYGKHWTDEVKDKISRSHLGKPTWSKGIPMSEETKKKLSESKKGKRPNEEARKHMSEAQKGRKHTDAAKKKISDANNRYYASGKRRNNKPVRCIETGEIFESGYAACRAKGLSNGTIGACLCGAQKTAGGYHWEFAASDYIIIQSEANAS